MYNASLYLAIFQLVSGYVNNNPVQTTNAYAKHQQRIECVVTGVEMQHGWLVTRGDREMLIQREVELEAGSRCVNVSTTTCVRH